MDDIYATALKLPAVACHGTDHSFGGGRHAPVERNRGGDMGVLGRHGSGGQGTVDKSAVVKEGLSV
jgi:hypothetical protein